jgi:uncharacterized damage-inducible protein DinB
VSEASIRPAFSTWPDYNRSLVEVVAALSPEQLAVTPTPDRWPLWATVGHLACQRVFWLCDFAGEPGADTTRFVNAAYDCPGDDDLEHVLDADALAEALTSTFAIVERCLDRWTVPMLAETLRMTDGDGSRVHTRGFVLQRVFAHDVYHAAELNETLGRIGSPLIDFWA